MFLEAYAGIMTLACAVLGVYLMMVKDDRDEALDNVDGLKQKSSNQWVEICNLEHSVALLKRELKEANEELADIKALGPKLEVQHVNFDGVRVYRAVQIHHAGPLSSKGAIDAIVKQAVKMGYMEMFDMVAPYLDVKMGEEWERIEKSPAKKIDPTTGATSQFVTVSMLIGRRK